MRKIHNIFMSMIFAISASNSFGMQMMEDLYCYEKIGNQRNMQGNMRDDVDRDDVDMKDSYCTEKIGNQRNTQNDDVDMKGSYRYKKKPILPTLSPIKKEFSNTIVPLQPIIMRMLMNYEGQENRFLLNLYRDRTFAIFDLGDGVKGKYYDSLGECSGDVVIETYRLPDESNYDRTQISFPRSKGGLYCIGYDKLRNFFYKNNGSEKGEEELAIFTISKKINFIPNAEMDVCIFYSVFPVRKIIEEKRKR